MKKYVKPELYYENFELLQHIAACGIDVNFSSGTDYSCNPKLDGSFWGGLTLGVFGEGRACELDVANIDVYCYTVGTNEAGRTFNS